MTTPYDPTGRSPRSQFYEAFDIPSSGYLNAAQRYQQRLFTPMMNLYGIEDALQTATGVDPGTFNEWLQPTSGAGGLGWGGISNLPGEMYNRAAGILSGIYSRGAGGRQDVGLSFNPEYDDFGQFKGQVPLATQKELFRLGLRTQMGPRGAARFAERLPTEQTMWESLTGRAEGPGVSFLDWLSNKYGLARFFGTGQAQVDAQREADERAIALWSYRR